MKIQKILSQHRRDFRQQKSLHHSRTRSKGPCPIVPLTLTVNESLTLDATIVFPLDVQKLEALNSSPRYAPRVENFLPVRFVGCIDLICGDLHRVGGSENGCNIPGA